MNARCIRRECAMSEVSRMFLALAFLHALVRGWRVALLWLVARRILRWCVKLPDLG